MQRLLHGPLHLLQLQVQLLRCQRNGRGAGGGIAPVHRGIFNGQLVQLHFPRRCSMGAGGWRGLVGGIRLVLAGCFGCGLGLGLCAGLRLLWRLWFLWCLRQCHPVDLALGITAGKQFGLAPAQRLDMGARLQGLDIVQLGLERIKPQQRRVLAIIHGNLGQQQLAVDAHHRLGVLLKADLQVGVQRAGLGDHRRTGGHIAEIGGEVYVLPAQLHRRLAVVHKGCALRFGDELAVIEGKGQVRQHLDFALGSKVADKGHAQLQAGEFMAALHLFVIQLHPAVAQRHVVQRKLQRLGIGFGRRLGQLFQHVVDVEMAPAVLRQAHRGCIHLDGVKHGR